MHFKKSILLAFIFFIINFLLSSLNAQTIVTDSLERLLNQHIKKDTRRVNLLNKTANKFRITDKDKLFSYANEAAKLADSLRFLKGKAESLRLFGLYYWDVVNYEKAFEYYQKSLIIFEEIKDKNGISNCYSNIGVYYKEKNQYSKSLEYYQKALILKKELGNKKEISDIYNTLGNICGDLSDYTKVLEFYQKSLAIRKELKNKNMIANSYNNIGVLYAHLSDYSKALEYYQKGVKLLGNGEASMSLAVLFQNIGDVYEFKKDYLHAEEYYQKALKIYINSGNENRIAFCYIDIGVTYKLKKEFSKALEYFNKSLAINVEPGCKYTKAYVYNELALLYFDQNKMLKAHNFSKKAYLLANEINHLNLLKKSSQVLAKSCNAIGEYNDAYQYSVIFKIINDSIVNKNNMKEIAKLEYRFKYESEIKLLKEKQNSIDIKLANEKNIKYFLFIVLIILIIFVVFVIISKLKIKNFYKNELRLINEIKEIDDNYKEILDANSDVVLMLNSEGKHLYINEQLKTLLGYDNKEMIGRPLTYLAPKSEIALYLQKLNDVFLLKQITAFETHILHKDGRHIPVEITGKVMKYEGETVVVGTIRDITNRKKDEEEIRKLLQAVEQSSATIVITDTDGKIEYANPFFLKTTGYTLKQAKGENPKILKSGHTTDAEYKELWNTIISGKTWQGEFINIKKNKEKYWEKAIISPVINDTGKIINYIAIKEDITEKKKAEQDLKDSEAKLRESNQTKDKFFSIISHDLKNPFNTILGFSNILLENHKEYNTEKRDKLIKSVNNSAKNAFKLLENLLTWSRSQSGAIKYSPEELHLKILLFEIMFDLYGQAEAKGITILDDVSENELIFADKNMIATVLRNLISNAIKFSNNGGSIIISSKKQENSNFIEISVADTGVGIQKIRIDDLFRIDKNTSTQGTENEKGTGLGLILCKEFIEKHGGKIRAESKIEKGSKFIFSIPCSSDSLSNINKIPYSRHLSN